MSVMTYTCKSCNKQYDYVPGNNSTKDLCASCRVMTKSKYYKQKAVEYKGGACQICGYNKCNSALDFHHVNPENKTKTLSYMFSHCSWDKIKEELDKCILVCANCHREIHQQGIQTLDNLIKLGYKSYSQEYKEEKAIKQKAIEEERARKQAEKDAAMSAVQAEKDAKLQAVAEEKARKEAALAAEKAEKAKALEKEKAEKAKALEKEKLAKQKAAEKEKEKLAKQKAAEKEKLAKQKAAEKEKAAQASAEEQAA